MSLNRRDFLKVTGLAAGALTLAPRRTRAAAPTPRNPTAALPETKIPTICEMCTSRCGVYAVVQAGRVVRIEGHPAHPINLGRPCARGNAGVSSLYDPDRLQGPMKRGADGKLQPISWDQAISEIGARLCKIRDTDGPHTVVWAEYNNLNSSLTRRFTEAFGSPNHTGHASTCFANRNVGYSAVFGTLPTVDYKNVKYYLSPGRNLLGGIKVYEVAELAEARARGARIVVLDPRYSELAGWGEWLAIKPAGDLAFLLALANVLISEGLYNKTWVEQHTTTSPMWRRPSPSTRRNGRYSTRTSRPTPSGASPARWQQPPRRWPSTRAGTAATACTGTTGSPAGAGPWTPYPMPTAERFDGAGTTYPLSLGSLQAISLAIESGKPYPLKAAIFFRVNPLKSAGQSSRWEAALQKLDLVVAIDTQMSETAMYAHYVLPESHYLERMDAVSVAGDTISVRQPVIKPLYDTKSGYEIIQDLARATGIGEYFNFTIEAYNEALVSPTGWGLSKMRASSASLPHPPTTLRCRLARARPN